MGIKVQIACLYSDPALFPPRPRLGTQSLKYKFVGNTHTLNSYQQNQKNKTDICSTKNEMHAGKKKKKQHQRLNCRLEKMWWPCPEHVQSEKQWSHCARAAGVLTRNCRSHRKLAGPITCPVDNGTDPRLKTGQKVFNKIPRHLHRATCERREGCALTPPAGNK